MTVRPLDVFPLDVLERSAPAHQLAGRFGVDVLGLLRPLQASSADEGARLCRYADLARSLDFGAIFGQGAPSRVSRAALRDHVLVVRPRGDFFSTDELALAQLRGPDDQWSLGLEITHCESQDGEPAPRDLYVLLCLEVGDRPLRSLALHFNGRRRDVHGNATPLAAPIAPAQFIEFSA